MGNPEDSHAAATSAKMGEAYGYRSAPLSGNTSASSVAAARPVPDSSKFHALEQSVQDLSTKLDKLITSSGQTTRSRVCGRTRSPTEWQTSANSRVCFECNAPGHISNDSVTG